jgi:hypothetical protein
MARFVTFGEIMLRLKPPGTGRFFQSPVLEATFGGGEANVATALAHFGCETSYVLVIPADAIGDAYACANGFPGPKRGSEWTPRQRDAARRVENGCLVFVQLPTHAPEVLVQLRHRPRSKDGHDAFPAAEEKIESDL